METIYTLVIRLYLLTIKIAALFNPKAKLWIVGRRNWHFRLSSEIGSNEKWIWVHCSSHGEFEDCAEVIMNIRASQPSLKILLTFFSPSGMKAISGKNIADHVTYLPIDTKSNAKKFLHLVKPKLILFSRSDLWYNFLSEVKRREIPTFLISALLNPSSNFIKWPQKIIYKKCYESFTQIYCQNDETKELLEKQFMNKKCTITGNSRVDRVLRSPLDRDFTNVSNFVGDSFCVIAGSCLKRDEKMILSVINQLRHLKIKWLIVPHEINEQEVDKQLSTDPSTFIKYSNMDALTKEHSVLYVDFVGGLKHLYKYGTIAIVGGGFNKIGIHNIIEPVFHGIPTTFGPNHKEYPEALALINKGFSVIHHNSLELKEIIERYYINPPNSQTKNNIREYVIKHSGASARIVDDIRSRGCFED